MHTADHPLPHSAPYCSSSILALVLLWLDDEQLHWTHEVAPVDRGTDGGRNGSGELKPGVSAFIVARRVLILQLVRTGPEIPLIQRALHVAFDQAATVDKWRSILSSKQEMRV